ncbi:MAG TPA: hypothetical protein VK009_05290 [Chloroflexota bacterium]|nr:hypothetical protein [Chloroflexota bacterium]
MKGLRAAALAIPLLLAGLPLAPAALADGQNASVTITDSGFNPPQVNIPVGGTVTWTNSGTRVHSATTKPTTPGTPQSPTPATFDSGGIGVGQSFSWNFTIPGTYIYASQPDCLNGNVVAGFTCTGYSVVVGSPSTAVAGAAPSAAPSPSTQAAAPAGTTIQQTATVSITDSGFSPANVAVATGGTGSTAGNVTFVNNGTKIHTATSTVIKLTDPRSAPQVFTTGGLMPGQSKTFTFIYPGTYQFTSDTDCQNGNTSTTFDCSTPYTITIMPGPVGGSVSAVAPPFSGPVVYWRDPAGYDPQSLTIQAGQTVTWMNLGSNVHSVVSDSASMPFDSGGLGVGSVFTATFNNPGTYTYHDSTQPIWTGNQITGYQFSGTIVVQPASS